MMEIYGNNVRTSSPADHICKLWNFDDNKLCIISDEIISI